MYIAAYHPTLRIIHEDYYDNDVTLHWSFVFPIAPKTFGLYDQEIRNVWQEKIKAALSEALLGELRSRISEVVIRPGVSKATPNWREKALQWTGEQPNNQGRAHSKNVAPMQVEGLLFRSKPEIYLYQALKKLKVTIAPLPVFIKGGEGFRRLEPDFVLVLNGKMMVVEVDGEDFHHESPVEASERLEALRIEGAAIERVRSSACSTPEKARGCAEDLVKLLLKYSKQ